MLEKPLPLGTWYLLSLVPASPPNLWDTKLSQWLQETKKPATHHLCVTFLWTSWPLITNESCLHFTHLFPRVFFFLSHLQWDEKLPQQSCSDKNCHKDAGATISRTGTHRPGGDRNCTPLSAPTQRGTNPCWGSAHQCGNPILVSVETICPVCCVYTAGVTRKGSDSQLETAEHFSLLTSEKLFLGLSSRDC